jgi:hypothetical protein
MESLKNFESRRNVTGYRLAWMPQRGKRAYWVAEPKDDWSGKHAFDRTAKLEISTTQYHGEKRVAKQGLYIAHTVQINTVRLTAKRIPKRADLAGVCGRKWVVSI